jgi:hypothetical protein
MARMIPNVDPAALEHESEERVYRALRDQVSSEYTVLHSYPWLRPWRGEGALVEGEADFVVVHPRRGFLVLEVKGGGTIRHDGYRWYRDTAEGPKEFRDPFEQGRRNMHALLEIISERSWARLSHKNLGHGYAVVFPHMNYRGQPPANADKAIIIAHCHMSNLDNAIDAAYHAWGLDRRPIDPSLYNMLLNDCLMPKFRVFKPVGPSVAEVSEKLLELTEHQAQVFEGLYGHDHVLVEGVAGSGKTFLALQRAIAFARCGKRTLFICYNKELANWLSRQVDEDQSLVEYRDLLVIKNFHALAAELADSAGIAFEPAGGGARDESFWDNEVPDLLEQAVYSLLDREHSVQFDALVVDEAQDFCEGWWYALTQTLLKTASAPVYAFLDPNQSLRGEVISPPVKFDTRFQLAVNCRNTRKIAAASAYILNLEAHTYKRAPNGENLRILRSSNERQQKGLAIEEIRRLLRQESISPSQIALIGASAKRNGSLVDVEEVDGTPLVTGAEAWRDGGGILVTTARSFKGLEADVVILYDLGEFGRLFKREDLYVACTRARVLLIAIVHGVQCRAVMEAAAAAAEG